MEIMSKFEAILRIFSEQQMQQPSEQWSKSKNLEERIIQKKFKNFSAK